MADWVPLNFELLKNPLNWAIVFLMLAFAGVLVTFLVGANNQSA